MRGEGLQALFQAQAARSRSRGNATLRLIRNDVLSRTWLAYLACVFNPYNGRLN
jgi:hypothetical protein